MTAVEPASAPNDVDTLITITGTGFTEGLSDTGDIIQPPVWLGDTQLSDVTWVSTTTLTASVPWGMNTSVYTLKVINPDDGFGSLTNAYTVTLGIGQWNGGNLFGGEVRQILLNYTRNDLNGSIYLPQVRRDAQPDAPNNLVRAGIVRFVSH